MQSRILFFLVYQGDPLEDDDMFIKEEHGKFLTRSSTNSGILLLLVDIEEFTATSNSIEELKEQSDNSSKLSMKMMW